MPTELITYQHDGTVLEGYFSYPQSASSRPAVLIVHEWYGRAKHVESVADKLSGLGYAAFALDMYGKGVLTNDATQASAWMEDLVSKPDTVFGRFRAGLEVLRARPEVDEGRVAAIGYCLGGFIALNVARTGEKLSAVAAFHAGLANYVPEDMNCPGPVCPVLVCHGSDDPFCGQEEVDGFVAEMKSYNADWQLLILGGAKHAFTNPAANSVGLDALKYDKKADERSWSAMTALLSEVLGE